ncbi:tail fiber protein; host specificity [Aeromonas phage BUCT695]|uniref:tail fiber protein; host specificity n=1 Tax=Aeromonas phage BUCT695 TaxID=2908630 RepID=UPI002329642A|nr:tail fiber protein; host specificity [Aeromonas phage BUCT695]UIW10590.1 virion structural protein [Aeromonas phage BUCT695]
MPIMKVRGIGQTGVIKDTPPFELPPSGFNDAMNVRFRQTSIEKFGGCLPVLTEGMPEKEIPLAILQRGIKESHIYATNKGIYEIQGLDHKNISKRKPDSEEPVQYNAGPGHTWYYTHLSNAIVMNTPEEDPQGLLPYENYFKDLPGWGYPQGPSGPKIPWKCARMRAFRNYLIALDMTENGHNLPQRIRWSNIAYVNELPPDWIENDETKDGGFNDLSDASGKLVDALTLRDSLVIYTDKETYLMDYVGGVLVFQFRKLFSDSGLLAPECVAEFEGKHFVVSHDDIFIHNGSTRQPVASGRIKDFLMEEISAVNSQATKVFAVPHRKEIWVSYVGPGEDVDDIHGWSCTKAAVWNWEYDNWTFYELPNCFDINICLPPESDLRNWDEYVNVGEDEWDALAQEKERWTGYGKDFLNQVVWGASEDGVLYLLDESRYMDRWKRDKIPVIGYVTRTHMDMDEMVQNTRSYKFVTTVVPQFSGEGMIACHVGGSQTSTKSPEWTDFQFYDIENDVKVDCYCNNRYPAFKFVSNDTAEWSFSGYDVEFKEAGNY